MPTSLFSLQLGGWPSDSSPGRRLPLCDTAGEYRATNLQ